MRIPTILAAAAAPAALAAILLGTTGTAFASTGPASNGQVGQMTGNNVKPYNDPVFGWVKVNETEHPKFDTVSAKFTDGQTATSLGMWPGETGTVGWNSDFTNPTHPGTGTLTYTINADGLGYTGQATYPPS
jgi:hypothetical protein